MPFQKGQSGNPAGKPKGCSKRVQLLNQLVMPAREEIVKKAIELAMDGNETMLKFLLERMLPARPKEEPIELEQELTGSMAEQAGQIMEFMTSGAIAVADGTAMLSGLTSRCRIVETTELLERVEALEAKAN